MVRMMMRHHNGIELFVAQCLNDCRSIIGRINHEGGCIIRNNESVVFNGAQHQILDVNGGARYTERTSLFTDSFIVKTFLK